jgi:xanthosine utilization system XapX-like protein
MNNYLIFFGFGLLGWLLQSLLKARSIQEKAKKANVEFKFMEYFTTDWLSHVISLVLIIIGVLLVEDAVRVFPQIETWLRAFFVTIGYSNGDIVSRFLSKVNTQVNDAIDHKTNISDTQTGTLNAPTPKA